jgi:hypothetical protein
MDQKILHKKLLVAQLVKKCSALYGIRMFIAVFTRVHGEPHDPVHILISHSFQCLQQTSRTETLQISYTFSVA